MSISNNSSYEKIVWPLIIFSYIAFWLSIIVYKTYLTALNPIGALSVVGNDDIYRLLSIRDWLNGQSWFDMTQYRVFAPDGISMHWSRYPDLFIAVLMTLFSFFMSASMAEGLTVAIWSTLLLFLLVAMNVRAGFRVFGPSQAALAAITLLSWPAVTFLYFIPAIIDHHNIQIVLMAFIIMSLISNRKLRHLGFIMGISAALSLAIGLENIILIAVTGLVLCVEAILDFEDRKGVLAGFGVSLAIGSWVFFVGQTPVDEWFVSYCDKLSIPYLVLTTVAGLICVTFVIGAKYLQTIKARSLLLLCIAVVGLFLVYPPLQSCLGGPYAGLLPEHQEYISNGIGETSSAISLATNMNQLFFLILLPAAWIIVISVLAIGIRMKQKSASRSEIRAACILLVFGATGIIGALIQFRMVVLVAPTLPLLAGFSLPVIFSSSSKTSARPLYQVGLLILISGTIFYPTIHRTLFLAGQTVSAIDTPSPIRTPRECREYDNLEPLAKLPAGSVMASSQISSSLLLASDHTIFNAPFHRNANALDVTINVFSTDESGFMEWLNQTGTDYVVLCRQHPFGDGQNFASYLANGGKTEGLEVLPLPEDSPLNAFKVFK